MPEAKTELDYTNVFELTVAVVLSAQCTDKRVNIITKNLFKSLPTAEVMAEASIDVIFDVNIILYWIFMMYKKLTETIFKNLSQIDFEFPQKLDFVNICIRI